MYAARDALAALSTAATAGSDGAVPFDVSGNCSDLRGKGQLAITSSMGVHAGF